MCFAMAAHVRKPEAAAGSLALYDLRRSWSADLRDPFDNLSMYLPLSSFRDFAEERASNFVELRFDIEHILHDRVMLHLAQAILPVLERPYEVNTLFLGSLFLAVGDHIAVTYGSFSKQTTRAEWGLTARQLRRILEYIEANLSQDMGLGDIAAAGASSISSLARGFKSALGISPHPWVLNRRIALAQRLIYEGAVSLSDVAVSCGFADQSHLTRVFMRKVRSAPSTWRRKAQMRTARSETRLAE
jgi:AraC family transcriptional regulator